MLCYVMKACYASESPWRMKTIIHFFSLSIYLFLFISLFLSLFIYLFLCLYSSIPLSLYILLSLYLSDNFELLSWLLFALSSLLNINIILILSSYTILGKPIWRRNESLKIHIRFLTMYCCVLYCKHLDKESEREREWT